MKRLFRIQVNDDAPKLEVNPVALYSSEFTALDGSP